MKILSNVELEKLTKEQSPRLKSLAKARCDRNPRGFLNTAELDEMINFCKYAGDEKATRWLQSLKILAKNGQLKRARTEKNSWAEHSRHIAMLHKKGEVAFDLFDHIMLKDTGKRGTVGDYLPEDKKYLVSLDPFQLQWFEKKELEKTAKVLEG